MLPDRKPYNRSTSFVPLCEFKVVDKRREDGFDFRYTKSQQVIAESKLAVLPKAKRQPIQPLRYNKNSVNDAMTGLDFALPWSAQKREDRRPHHKAFDFGC